MDYQVLTVEDQAKILRNNLLQAEADYFTHSLQRDEIQAQLDVLPPPTNKPDDPNIAVREQGETKLGDFDQLIKAAESRAVLVKSKLDAKGEPVKVIDGVAVDAKV